jgi:hypothetical protein
MDVFSRGPTQYLRHEALRRRQRHVLESDSHVVSNIPSVGASGDGRDGNVVLVVLVVLVVRKDNVV